MSQIGKKLIELVQSNTEELYRTWEQQLLPHLETKIVQELKAKTTIVENNPHLEVFAPTMRRLQTLWQKKILSHDEQQALDQQLEFLEQELHDSLTCRTSEMLMSEDSLGRFQQAIERLVSLQKDCQLAAKLQQRHQNLYFAFAQELGRLVIEHRVTRELKSSLQILRTCQTFLKTFSDSKSREQVFEIQVLLEKLTGKLNDHFKIQSCGPDRGESPAFSKVALRWSDASWPDTILGSSLDHSLNLDEAMIRDHVDNIDQVCQLTTFSKTTATRSTKFIFKNAAEQSLLLSLAQANPGFHIELIDSQAPFYLKIASYSLVPLAWMMGEVEETAPSIKTPLNNQSQEYDQREAALAVILENNSWIQPAVRATQQYFGIETSPLKPKIKPQAQLIEIAKLHLQTWVKEKLILKGYGKFVIYYEILESEDPQFIAMLPEILAQWDSIIADLKAQLPPDGKLKNRAALETYFSYFREKLKPRMAKHISKEARMTQNLICNGSNCEGRGILMLCAWLDSGAQLPKGFDLGAQPFEDHLETVILEAADQSVWEFGRGWRVDKILDTIYHPPLLFNAYLAKRDPASMIDYEDLVLAKYNVEIKEEISRAYNNGNTSLEFPPGHRAFMPTYVDQDGFNLMREFDSTLRPVDTSNLILGETYGLPTHQGIAIHYTHQIPSEDSYYSQPWSLNRWNNPSHLTVNDENLFLDFYQLKDPSDLSQIRQKIIRDFVDRHQPFVEKFLKISPFLVNLSSLQKSNPTDLFDFIDQFKEVKDEFEKLVELEAELEILIKNSGVFTEPNKEMLEQTRKNLFKKIREQSLGLAKALEGPEALKKEIQEHPERFHDLFKVFGVKTSHILFFPSFPLEVRESVYDKVRLAPNLRLLPATSKIITSNPSPSPKETKESIAYVVELQSIDFEDEITSPKSAITPSSERPIEVLGINAFRFIWSDDPKQQELLLELWTPDVSKSIATQPKIWAEVENQINYEPLVRMLYEIQDQRELLKFKTTPKVRINSSLYKDFEHPDFSQSGKREKITEFPETPLAKDLAEVLDSYLRFHNPDKH